MAGLRTGVAIALALALSPALGACGGSDTVNVADIASYTVSRRDVRITVSEKGALKASKQILIRPQIPGQAKIVSLIPEGTKVQAGDELAQLDQTAVEKEITDLENRVIALDGQYKAAQAELEIQLSQNEADIRDSQLELKFARVDQELYEKGEFVQQETQRKTRVEEAISSLDRAKRKYEQMPDLLAEGFVTTEQVEEERINMVRAESELELARLDLSTYLEYTAPKEKQRAEADVRNAELDVARTEQRALAREAQKRSDVKRQGSELENVRARLAERRDVLKNMTILAPAPGIVIYGDARNPWDDREVKVGENVYSRQAFLTLPDLSEMQVVIAVHEADIARVEVGQSAFITVETVRGRTLDGRVERVALVPKKQGRRWSDDIKRFEVEVTLEGDLAGLELKPGLTSRVEVLVGELKGVLAVPVQAVFAEKGKFWVFKRTSDGYERATVKIAPGNSQYAVITEGIDDGDEIALYNPERAEDMGGGGPSIPGGDGEDSGGDGRP